MKTIMASVREDDQVKLGVRDDVESVVQEALMLKKTCGTHPHVVCTG